MKVLHRFKLHALMEEAIRHAGDEAVMGSMSKDVSATAGFDVEARYAADGRSLVLCRIMAVCDVVADPMRELSLEMCAAAGLPAEVGDELLIQLDWGDGTHVHETLGLPFSTVMPELSAAVQRAVLDAAKRYVPASVYAEGTVGRMFSDALTGLRARHGAIEIEILESFAFDVRTELTLENVETGARRDVRATEPCAGLWLRVQLADTAYETADVAYFPRDGKHSVLDERSEKRPATVAENVLESALRELGENGDRITTNFDPARTIVWELAG